MALEVNTEVSRWKSADYYGQEPSVHELIRVHNVLHHRDKFARVVYEYPFGIENVATAFKELIPKEDYEFFQAKIAPWNKMLGWTALSFDISGKNAENKAPYEAKLEMTEMYSHILKMWKFHGASGRASLRYDQASFYQSTGQASSSRLLHLHRTCPLWMLQKPGHLKQIARVRHRTMEKQSRSRNRVGYLGANSAFPPNTVQETWLRRIQ